MQTNITHAMGHVRCIHFIGIGGAGMGGIAEVLHNMGYQISGSDLYENAMVRHLGRMGVKIFIGHIAAQVIHADVVVISSALHQDNLEWQAAKDNGIPVVRRAEMLAELMRFKKGIAIAGTHGKSTTTSLLASVLQEADLDPTYVIGGLLNRSGSHAQLGQGEFLLAEADESDTSFLHLSPVMAVVTNIDADHLDNYANDYQCLLQIFVDFIHQLPFYGLAVLCHDDPGIQQILPQLSRRVLTYGIHEGADYQAHAICHQGTRMIFKVCYKGCPDWLTITLNMPGEHNMLNALAVISLSHTLGIAPAVIHKALEEFQGISRRSDVHGELQIAGHPILLVDDYAHHPNEILAILSATQHAWPERRLLVIFQPHRYSRTQALFEDFIKVLAMPEVLFLLDVYAAGEQPIPTADSRALCRALRLQGSEPVYIENRTDLYTRLAAIAQPGDVLLTLGAGDISSLAVDLKMHFASMPGDQLEANA